MTVLSSLSNSPEAPFEQPNANRGAAETPLLAFLGLGLFCWIFLTNSLPAKRELGGRLAQVERYTAEGGQLARLREELAEEEGLARAVREDAVVRRALFLLEHPTAPENAPENLLTSLSMNLPAEPETLVEEEPPIEEFELPEDESVPGDTSTTSGVDLEVPARQPDTRIPASNPAELPPTDAPLEPPPDTRRSASDSAKLRGNSDSGKNDSGKSKPKVGPSPSSKEGERPKAPATGANTPKKPALGPAAKNSKPEDPTGKAPRSPGKTPPRKSSPNAPPTAGSRPPGTFEVPSFLRG